MQKYSKWDAAFDMLRPIALVFLLIFSIFGGVQALAMEAKMQNLHNGDTVHVDLERPGDFKKEIAKVAQDWRRSKECPISEVTLTWLNDILKDLKVRGKLPKNPVVYVLSGYRSPETNKLVGGAEHSQHMKCTALDIRVGGVSTRNLYLSARATQAGGLGVYLHLEFIHIDSGRKRAW